MREPAIDVLLEEDNLFLRQSDPKKEEKDSPMYYVEDELRKMGFSPEEFNGAEYITKKGYGLHLCRGKVAQDFVAILLQQGIAEISPKGNVYHLIAIDETFSNDKVFSDRGQQNDPEISWIDDIDKPVKPETRTRVGNAYHVERGNNLEDEVDASEEKIGDIDILTQYIQKDARHELLTREQEQEIARSMIRNRSGFISLVFENPLAVEYMLGKSRQFRNRVGFYGRISDLEEDQENRGNFEERITSALKMVKEYKREFNRGYSKQKVQEKQGKVARMLYDMIATEPLRAYHAQKIADKITMAFYSFDRKAEQKEEEKDKLKIRKRLEQLFALPYDKIEEKIRSIESCREGYIQATHELARHNTRLVISIAKNYRKRSISFLDLIGHGNEGLMGAVERYDPERGYRFATYATWWIRQKIIRAIANYSSTIRIPIHTRGTLANIMKYQNELRHELGREPSLEDLAEAMGMPERAIALIEMRSRTLISLDQLIKPGEEDTHMKYLVEDEKASNPLFGLDDHLLKEKVDEVLDTLDPRERAVIEMRYGINQDGGPKTLEEVGKVFKITRERIRQIESMALRKLAHPLRRAKLEPFAFDRGVIQKGERKPLPLTRQA